MRVSVLPDHEAVSCSSAAVVLKVPSQCESAHSLMLMHVPAISATLCHLRHAAGLPAAVAKGEVSRTASAVPARAVHLHRQRSPPSLWQGLRTMRFETENLQNEASYIFQ